MQSTTELRRKRPNGNAENPAISTEPLGKQMPAKKPQTFPLFAALGLSEFQSNDSSPASPSLAHCGATSGVAVQAPPILIR
ncbi:MAG: hypothetical protein ACLVJN_04610 [Streptococcus parasanguinis]